MRLDALAQRLLETVFPARCFGCQRLGTPLCTDCRGDLPLLPTDVCARCAAPRRATPRDLGVARGARRATRPAADCRDCARLSAALGSVRAIYAYDGGIKRAVHILKFRSGRYLAPVLGELLREHLARRPLRADLVAPVPMARARLVERGYNHAALLAEQIAAAVGGTCRSRVLERQERPAQQQLGASQRLVNLSGSISCARPAAVHGRRVLLVDDVMTTGATLSACAEALAHAGAQQVIALVLARDL